MKSGQGVQWAATTVELARTGFSATLDSFIAADPTGRVVVTFPIDDGVNESLCYQECDAATSDCSSAASWTSGEIASTIGFVTNLAFDTAGTMHLVQIDPANDAYDTTYNSRPRGGAWSADAVHLSAHLADDGSFSDWPAAGAGTPNNIYGAWYEFTVTEDENGNQTAVYTLQYSHWDGHEWSLPRTPGSWGLASMNYDGAPAMVVDKNNVMHLAWQGENDEILYSSARQVEINVGATPPNEDPNHKFLVTLGDSLELSHATYGQMGYGDQLNVIPKPDHERYPVYISSDPIWTNVLPRPIGPGGITFPDQMYIARTADYSGDPNAPIDWLRTQLGSHEFYHTLQWTYVSWPLVTWVVDEELRWWMEATAQWAQPHVYQQDGSYPSLLDYLLANPELSMVVRPLSGISLPTTSLLQGSEC